jgi:hypothetical protein
VSAIGFEADRCGAGAVKLGACLLSVLAVWGLRGILPTGVQEGLTLSTLAGFYLYGVACLVSGFVFGMMWGERD